MRLVRKVKVWMEIDMFILVGYVVGVGGVGYFLMVGGMDGWNGICRWGWWML